MTKKNTTKIKQQIKEKKQKHKNNKNQNQIIHKKKKSFVHVYTNTAPQHTSSVQWLNFMDGRNYPPSSHPPQQHRANTRLSVVLCGEVRGKQA